MKVKLDIFNSRSMEQTLVEIERYKKELKRKCQEFVERVGKLGIETAKTYIGAYSIPSEVIGEIYLEKGDVVVSDGSIKIVVGNDTALFWEYGTGIEGLNATHPDTSGWEYDWNAHDEKGWVYTAESGGLTAYSWKVGEGLYQTKGMPSQPFMYLTYNALLNQKFSEIVSIAKEVFG